MNGDLANQILQREIDESLSPFFCEICEENIEKDCESLWLPDKMLICSYCNYISWKSSEDDYKGVKLDEVEY